MFRDDVAGNLARGRLLHSLLSNVHTVPHRPATSHPSSHTSLITLLTSLNSPPDLSRTCYVTWTIRPSLRSEIPRAIPSLSGLSEHAIGLATIFLLMLMSSAYFLLVRLPEELSRHHGQGFLSMYKYKLVPILTFL